MRTVQDETLNSVKDKIVDLGKEYETMGYLAKVNAVGYAIELMVMFAELTAHEIEQIKGQNG